MRESCFRPSSARAARLAACWFVSPHTDILHFNTTLYRMALQNCTILGRCFDWFLLILPAPF